MNQRPRFFKVILPVPSASQHLRIPTKFVTHIKKDAFRRATLRDPSHCCWPVELCKIREGVFIKHGWDQFYKAHSLGNYEFLIFTYDGGECFDVRIFDSHGLERVSSVHQIEDSREPMSSEHGSGDESETESETEEVYASETHQEVTVVYERRRRGRPRKVSASLRLQPSHSLAEKGDESDTESESEGIYAAKTQQEAGTCQEAVVIGAKREKDQESQRHQRYERRRLSVWRQKHYWSEKKIEEEIIEISDEEFETDQEIVQKNKITDASEGTSNVKRKRGRPRKHPHGSMPTKEENSYEREDENDV